MAKISRKLPPTPAKRSTSKRAASGKTTPAGSRTADVDAYIQRAQPFAKLILTRIRAAFLKASPEIMETIKWGVPHFVYNGNLGGMAAFKNHVSFGFWKSKLMDDPANLFRGEPRGSMCVSRFACAEELPAEKVLIAYVKAAMALNEPEAVAKQAAARARGKKNPPKPVVVPPDLHKLLMQPRNVKARETFEALPPSHKREYIEWVNEAKRDETRQKRLATTLEYLNQGRSKNWKYKH
ncbi:MAG: YdeI/OmpD-associated family protein [Phycisphaerae bacterium]|nr:YdeI/OmpD-associated family protein [Phycisphaerae bacterium]